MTRLLIVNGDDFGLTPGICEAILTAHRDGIVTSTSALVVGPSWDDYSSALVSSGLGVGAHLCAVGEDPPLLTAAEVPTLVDRRGRFPLTWRTFVARSGAGRVDSDDLRREFGAQIERMRQSGVRLTHVDSHQNLHHFPQVATLLFEIAEAEGIGAARVARSRGWSPGRLGLRILARRFQRECDRRGIVTPEGATGLDEAGSLSLQPFIEAVTRLGASGVASAEIATHPGTAADPERYRYLGWRYHWADEYEALRHPAARQAVEAAGFTLGDFGDLVESRGHAAA